MIISSIPANLQVTLARITTALRLAKRTTPVTLIAVSKNFSAEDIIVAAEAGQLEFGENYLQEAIDKINKIAILRPDLKLKWHFIGSIQTNKTRQLATYFDWVHTVASEKIAQRLSEQRPVQCAPLQVCIQVNIDQESSKSGVSAPEALLLARSIQNLPRLALRGLMTIPALGLPHQQRLPFAKLRMLAQQLQSEQIPIDTLSMGMSNDLEAAILEGATILRVGTAIFGQRSYAK